MKAVKKDFRWVEMEPGRINIAFPTSKELLVKLRENLDHGNPTMVALKELEALEKGAIPSDAAKKEAFDNVKKALKHQYWANRSLLESPISLIHKHNSIVISLGVGEGQPISFVFKGEEKPLPKMPAALLEHAKTLGVPIRVDLSADALLDEFAKKHTPKE